MRGRGDLMPSHNGRRWTDAETKMLERLRWEGNKWHVIGNAIGRSATACQVRADTRGFIINPKLRRAWATTTQVSLSKPFGHRVEWWKPGPELLAECRMAKKEALTGKVKPYKPALGTL